MLNKESMYKWMIIFMVVISFGSFSHADKIIYVDDDATGANDGSSWQNAYIYLQDALADANSSDKPIEIRVAQGIYKPDMGAGQTGGDREASFSLINDVTISGGYAGVLEVDPNARDIDMYETILSGDLFGDDKEVNDQFGGFINEPTRSENSYHVVTVSDTDSNAVIDGFLITAGNANGPILEIPYPEDIKFQRGGGIYCSSGDPNITHCIIIRNSGNIGGGMYNTNSNPILTNCIFRRNSSYYGGGMVNIDNSSPIMLGCIFDKNLVYHMGGGIYNIESNSILKNCEFVMNKAVTILGKGGGIYNYYSDLTLTDCIFDDNYSQENGGGIHNTDYPSPMFSHEQTLINCTFTRNSAGNGGGIYNEFANPTLINCKFIENCASYDGGGILNYEEGEPILNNCEFVGNTAARNGGGIYVSYHTILNNCILSGNLALQNGGGIYIQTGLTHIQRNLILDNCALYGNRANKLGGGIFSSGRVKASISNSILWANSATQGKQVALLVYVGPNTNSYYSSAAFQYSNIQEGDSGIYKEFEENEVEWLDDNIDTDPLFADPGYWDMNDTPEDANDDFWINGDYHLKSQAGRWDKSIESCVKDDVTSPCIDSGDPNTPIGLEPFPNGGYINMGAYGVTSEASKSYFGKPVCETIVAGDINGDCKVDILDLEIMLNHWLEEH